jgi:kumamolisin
MIQLTGTADQFAKVFHVALNRYQHPADGSVFVAPDREPSLDLDVAIQEVIGLDDEVLPSPRLVTPAAGEAAPDTTGSGPNGQFIGSDMRAAYYGDGPLTGAGQSVGLMELKGYDIASVNTYFANLGQSNRVPVVTVSTDSTPVDCITHCDDSEQALDIEYAISMAPRLASVEVYVGRPEDVLNSMASRNSSRQLSTSWGWKERFATDDALFKEMAAQGQTFLTASGDYSSLRRSGPWPEEDVNLTGVGGTDLVTDGPGGAWISESGWKYSAGGPSLDRSILIAPYQWGFVTAGNRASHRVRNVPDVAGQSNINMYFCGNRGCGRAGGTSFASPMWAGFIAMANQRAAANGLPPVGFLNPALYRLAAVARTASVLHDQTEGANSKFECTTSFDMVTGLGSMTPQLINALVKP